MNASDALLKLNPNAFSNKAHRAQLKDKGPVKLFESLSKGQRRNVFALGLVIPYNARRPDLLEAGALCLDYLTMLEAGPS